jgi:hypothetical protein
MIKRHVCKDLHGRVGHTPPCVCQRITEIAYCKIVWYELYVVCIQLSILQQVVSGVHSEVVQSYLAIQHDHFSVLKGTSNHLSTHHLVGSFLSVHPMMQHCYK